MDPKSPVVVFPGAFARDKAGSKANPQLVVDLPVRSDEPDVPVPARSQVAAFQAAICQDKAGSKANPRSVDSRLGASLLAGFLHPPVVD